MHTTSGGVPRTRREELELLEWLAEEGRRMADEEEIRVYGRKRRVRR